MAGGLIKSVFLLPGKGTLRPCCIEDAAVFSLILAAASAVFSFTLAAASAVFSFKFAAAAADASAAFFAA